MNRIFGIAFALLVCAGVTGCPHKQTTPTATPANAPAAAAPAPATESAPAAPAANRPPPN